MRTLDRYIVSNFLISALLCFVVLMSLRVVADLFVNIDEFTKVKDPQQERTAGAVVSEIGMYYGNQSLAYFRELGGVMVVAAAAFTLWRMNHTNELTAVLASGVSLHRVLAPIVLCSIGLNLLVILDSEVFIPRVKYQLVRNRDDPTGADAYQVRLVTDGSDSAWYSRRFYPAEGRLLAPLVILRDKDLAYAGHITGPEAAYDPGQGGWVFAHISTLQVPQWKEMPTTAWIPTLQGPAQIIADARSRPANQGVDWREVPGIGGVAIKDYAGNDETGTPILKLTLTAERMGLEAEGDLIRGTVLENPRFVFHRPDGKPYAVFAAAEATYHADPPRYGWSLTDGRLVYSCDLNPGDLSLRQSSDWLSYMSTGELNGLLRLQRVPDLNKAMLVRHCRFADFFNNIIMLLVAVPFILSRERTIKASAGLTVLTAGVAYVFVHLSRYLGLSPALAAWLPILVFGPVAAFMLDSVKT